MCDPCIQSHKYEYLRDLGVDGWIILGLISRGWDVGIWTGLGWPRIERQVADACEFGNEPSGSVKCGGIS